MFINNCKPLLVPLPRVCRLWNQLATPLLYRQLSTDFRQSDHRQLNHLLRTLHTHPRYYTHVRELRLDELFLTPTADVEFLKKASPHVRSLDVTDLCLGYMKHDAFSAIGSMKLEKLVMTGRWCKPAFDYLVKDGALDMLHTLQLYISEYECNHTCFVEMPVEPYSLPIQHLTISADTWSSKKWEEMVSLSRSLRSLNIDMTATAREWCVNTDAIYTTAIQRILNLQRESLQEIEITEFWSEDKDRVVDLSSFPNITSLNFHYRNLLYQTSPEDASRKLSCPQLERLSIDMNFNDQQHNGYVEVDEEELNWLVGFINDRRERLSIDKLQEIHIDFRPGEDIHDDWITRYMNKSPWPTERIEVAAKRLKQLGIRLSWHEPFWTKEEWASICEWHKIPGQE